MSADRVLQAPAEPVDRILQRLVLEGGDLPAAVADDVMVVLAAWKRGLVTGGGADVEAVDEPHSREQIERPVDARDADQPAISAQAVEDLLRGQAAVLAGEKLDDRGSRPARAVTGQLELGERVIGPDLLLWRATGHAVMIARIKSE